MNDKYVKKSDVFKTVDDSFRFYEAQFGLRRNDITILRENMLEGLRAIPAADTAIVVNAKWECVGNIFYECSNCGYAVTSNELNDKYCSNCGAKMEGDQLK